MARILLCYLVRNSGHHAAARAIEAELHRLHPRVETLCVDLLAYTHPRWSAVIQRTYMTTIRRTPDVWETFYDSSILEILTRRIRGMIQRGRSRTLLQLMDDFRPDAAICTQAHPLSVLSAYADRQRRDLPLFGAITDYVPHRFWVSSHATPFYYAASESAADRLRWLGVLSSRVLVTGIPIHPPSHPGAHRTPTPSEGVRILVMGGSRGLGSSHRTIRHLDRVPGDFTIDVVTGMNRRLRAKLLRHRKSFRHPIRIRGYVRNAAALMRGASLLISKPGGVTSAEATAMGLPMLIVRALPGQERGNADALVRHGAAIHIKQDRHLEGVLRTLLDKPDLLAMMRERALSLGRPNAATAIAHDVLRRLAVSGPGPDGE